MVSLRRGGHGNKVRSGLAPKRGEAILPVLRRVLSTRQEIWRSPLVKSLVDGVPDGGRQTNRRTTGHQADGKHQILGREQYRRTTGHQTDDQRRATDLAVGGSNPSRRALNSRFASRWSMRTRGQQ